MTHLSPAALASRRTAASIRIVSLWAHMQGSDLYGLQCPCLLQCLCNGEEAAPRLVLGSCLYPGELDYFIVMQPFLAQYGFNVTWFCNICNAELACGFPQAAPA